MSVPDAPGLAAKAAKQALDEHRVKREQPIDILAAMRLNRLFGFASILLAAASARAHFPFVVADPGGAAAHIVMSETLEPDPGVDVGIISGATFSIRDHDGRETPLAAEKAARWLAVSLPGGGTRVVTGAADLGVTQRGKGPAYVLVYHPKAIIGDAFDPSTVLGAKTPIELVPVKADGGFKLKLLIGGAPAAAKELRLVASDETETDCTTDDQGLTQVFAEPGRYAAWARNWVDEPGRRGDKEYAQVRHYATLVFDFPGSGASSAASTASPGLIAVKRAELPRPIASFGAAASDGWLYVYGGHAATRHEYSTVSVSGDFNRVRLRDLAAVPGSDPDSDDSAAADAKWENLAGGVKVQGLNLAAHGGKIYRVGGMEPRNAPGEKSDNYSVSEAAAFDPAVGTWSPLPPLPRPRSSHDVVFVGDQLMVIGGWSMKGRGGKTEWLDTVDILDLSSSQPQWRSVPQPFQRRALIVAALDGKIYVMGGFDENDEPQLDVDVYDVAKETWSKGPSIPGDQDNGFAPAACACQGSVYLSVGTGEMFRLSADRQSWEPFARSTPRIVHRLVPCDSEILILGGAMESRMSGLIEAVPVNAAAATAGVTDRGE